MEISAQAEDYINAYSIPMRQVEQVLNQPEPLDVVETLTAPQGKPTCEVRFRDFDYSPDKGRSAYTLLALNDSRSECITSLHAVPTDGSEQPVQSLFRDLARDFGRKIRVGQQYHKCFVEIEVPRSGRPNEVETPDETGVIADVRIKQVKKMDSLVHVALAIAIDAKAVAEHLGLV